MKSSLRPALSPTAHVKSRHVDRTFRGVIALIERQARLHPGATAIEDGETLVSYGALDRLANGVASHLLQGGSIDGRVVGILATPRWQTIVGILGILKAGGAYLPLDTRQPWKRSESMLEECDASLLVGATPQRLPKHWSNRYFSLDRVQRLRSVPPIRVDLQPDQLAYVLYTSGTTGQPNGVLVTHDNLRHSTVARLRYYEQAVGRFLLLSPLTFDSSVAGLFWTLSTGGSLVLPYPTLEEQLPRLTDTIAERSISHLLCVPSLWTSVLGRTTTTRLSTDLTTVIVAGEPCPIGLVRDHFHRAPHVRLFNEYGPTEATVWSSVHKLTDPNPNSVPIGQAIPGMRAYVVDGEMRQADSGQVGELCLAGRGVTKGYLKRPGLNAKRFVKNPFDNGEFGRMYRTGDLVRTDADGNLVFCGRVDHQIQIRGRRIEPEGIEALLATHATVHEAAVVSVHERLCACVVPSNGSTCRNSELRGHLARHLPEFMVPSEFRWLKTLPRTKHGKVDRNSLVLIEETHRQIDAVKSPPNSLDTSVRDPLELELVRISERVLNRRGLSLHDNFFKIGGDSLTAFDLLAHIEQRFGRQLSLADLVSEPDFESLATRLRQNADPSRWSPLVSLRPEGAGTPLFMIHPGGGNALCYLGLSRGLGKDRPLYGLQAPGVDGVRAPLESVGELAEEYLEAVFQVHGNGPYAIAGWSFGGLVAYEMACRLTQRGEQVAFLGVIDAAVLYSVQVIRTLFPVDIPLFHLLGVDEDVLLPQFRKMGRIAGLIPPAATEEQARRILHVFRANAKATIEYRPEPYSAKMTLMAASETLNRRKANPLKEWQPLCKEIAVETIDGGHLTLLNPVNVDRFAAVLRRHLDAALGAGGQ